MNEMLIFTGRPCTGLHFMDRSSEVLMREVKGASRLTQEAGLLVSGFLHSWTEVVHCL